MHKCNDCKFYREADKTRGYCYFDPPKIVTLPMAVKQVNIKSAESETVTVQPASVRPLVLINDFCAHFANKIHMM